MLKTKVFLDTNILLDVLCGSRPSSEASLRIFQAIRFGLLEGSLTTQSILDASYILSRTAQVPAEVFGKKILSLMQFINIESIHCLELKEALLRHGEDLEDDAQFAHARFEGCDAVISSDRRLRERRGSPQLPVYSPEEFLAKMQ